MPGQVDTNGPELDGIKSADQTNGSAALADAAAASNNDSPGREKRSREHSQSPVRSPSRHKHSKKHKKEHSHKKSKRDRRDDSDHQDDRPEASNKISDSASALPAGHDSNVALDDLSALREAALQTTRSAASADAADQNAADDLADAVMADAPALSHTDTAAC